ncbi:MAG: citrate synthase [Chloroflexota bacterium]|jgi:citrate synthase|nr:citrate synthase [Chloroflexota bacterium]
MIDTQVVDGLEGVVSHRTQLSEVDGAAGRLVIRGYDVDELVGKVCFEEAAYLLWHGELPTSSPLAALREEMAEARRLPAGIRDWLQGAGREAEGMHALRMGAAMLTLDDPIPDNGDHEVNLQRAARITARIPALVAHHARARRGLAPVEAPAHLGVAASYLYMLEGQEPDPGRVAALDAYLVTVIEHGMNASTFAARVIASTRSDMVSAVTGAIGALKGPLHGGVPGPVLEMLDEIGAPDRAEAWIRAALARGEVIMGFGHRVYKVRDPRAAVLSRVAAQLAAASGDRRLLELTEEVERVTVNVLAEVKPGRDLYANMELYAALVLHGVGIAPELFTPTFAVARTAGWTAHILEQQAANRLIRPQSVYAGPRDRRFVPIGER